MIKHGAHKQCLARDATKVCTWIFNPLVRFRIEILKVSGTSVSKSGVAIECLTSGSVHVETRVLVSDLLVEVHRNATDRVSDAFETLEVDFDIVIDVDPEVGLDRVNQTLGSVGAVFALRECRVDSLFSARGLNRNPQVSRERHEINGFVLRIDPGDHDRVGPLPRLLHALPIQKCRGVDVRL